MGASAQGTRVVTPPLADSDGGRPQSGVCRRIFSLQGSRGRATLRGWSSADPGPSCQKLEQEPLSAEAVRGVLDLTPATWFDRTEAEENDGSTEGLRRIPGLVARASRSTRPSWPGTTTRAPSRALPMTGWPLSSFRSSESSRSRSHGSRMRSRGSRRITEIGPRGLLGTSTIALRGGCSFSTSSGSGAPNGGLESVRPMKSPQAWPGVLCADVNTAHCSGPAGRDDAPAVWSSGPEHRAGSPPPARPAAPRRKGQPLPDPGVNRPYLLGPMSSPGIEWSIPQLPGRTAGCLAESSTAWLA